MSKEFSCEYAMSAEVAKMCVVAKGPDHGPAPIPEEGKWIQAKEITDISATVRNCGFAVFSGACANGGSVRGIVAKNGAAMLTRKEIDKLTEHAKGIGAKGLAYMRWVDDEPACSFAKFMKPEEIDAIIKKHMMAIPNIIADDVPLGPDDSHNVQVDTFLEAKEFDYDIPYHLDILESVDGIDIDSARKTSGQGFYYLNGNIARLHSAILTYARDFMIDKGFTYCIPPFMIRSEVVSGVMSFEEMESMMYKIEGEDLYLIGTSEHSMIGRFMNTIIDENKLDQFLECLNKKNYELISVLDFQLDK